MNLPVPLPGRFGRGERGPNTEKPGSGSGSGEAAERDLEAGHGHGHVQGKTRTDAPLKICAVSGPRAIHGAMLTTLRISGFAIVDAVEVRFGPGLNVLTGETGAGKSILVNALHLVLGGRMTAEVLRDGADEAVVEALFELPPGHPVFGRLEAAGLRQARAEQALRQAQGERKEGATCELLVRRIAARGGRGRAFVNGALCTVGMLETALRGLVDISGQHEHVSLLDPAQHLELLDAFAGTALRQAQGQRSGEECDGLEPLLDRIAACTRRSPPSSASGRPSSPTRSERARRADYLAFQLRELEAVDPRPGELEALEVDRRVLASAEKLREAARAAEALAYGGEGSASERVGQAARALAEAALLDRRLEGPRRSCAPPRSSSRRRGASSAATPTASAEIPSGSRRSRIGSSSLARARPQARRHARRGASRGARAMREELAGLRAAATGWGRSRARSRPAARRPRGSPRARPRARRAARVFATRCGASSKGSRWAAAGSRWRSSGPRASVEVGRPDPRAVRRRAREILIAPNPGESPRPLARIASGGELSRLLLAVKRTLARERSGRDLRLRRGRRRHRRRGRRGGGAAAPEVSRGRQVVCITHLPQVAAFADRHHRVEKRVIGGRTHATVALLEEEPERRGEVARMMAGATVTASALEHAGALIAAARSRAAAAEAGRRAAPLARPRPAGSGAAAER